MSGEPPGAPPSHRRVLGRLGLGREPENLHCQQVSGSKKQCSTASDKWGPRLPSPRLQPERLHSLLLSTVASVQGCFLTTGSTTSTYKKKAGEIGGVSSPPEIPPTAGDICCFRQPRLQPPFCSALPAFLREPSFPTPSPRGSGRLTPPAHGPGQLAFSIP